MSKTIKTQKTIAGAEKISTQVGIESNFIDAPMLNSLDLNEVQALGALTDTEFSADLIKRKRKTEEERLSEMAERVEDAMSLDGIQVSQIESTLTTISGAITEAGAAVSGSAGAAASTAGYAAAGVSGAAGGAATVTQALAASSASVATATSLSTAASLGGISSLAGVGGAVALGAAAGGGGGDGGGAPDPEPDPLPPANPFPSSDPEVDDATLSPPTEDDDTAYVHRLSVGGTSLPAAILNKSMVIDLGVSYGALRNTLYLTTETGGVVNTQVVSYRDIHNVTGTSVNDQITGHAGSNLLDGGNGDDIIYGAGGADTLRGGDGQDWLLFNPLTRGGGAGPYDDGVTVELDGIFSESVSGFYRSASQTGGQKAEASGFEHVAGSAGADSIVGTTGHNILAGDAGDDRLEGLAGDDHLFGGAAGNQGNQLIGGEGKDLFWVGYDINPVTRVVNITGTTATVSAPGAFDPQANATGLTTAINHSVVRDWDSAADGIRVASGSVAIVGGLAGTSGWSGDDTVDLRTNGTNLGVVNLGIVKVAAGAGNNSIYTSSGTEQIWTGYQFLAVNDVIDGVSAPTASAAATDIVWGWDDQTPLRDQLNVAAGSTAVIGLLQGKADWSANDTVDLRQQVSNNGTIVVSQGLGNNLFYGSAGADKHYGSAGAGKFNQVWGGTGADEFHVGTDRSTNGTTATVASKDLIWDFAATEVLRVSENGVAVLAGLESLNWADPNVVNLAGSNITNSGTIVIALGAGDDTIIGSSGVDHIYGGTSTAAGNRITGGSGNDHFYVGFIYSPLAGAVHDADGRTELGPNDIAIDLLLDWQDTDNLTVGTRGRAVVGGLYGVVGWDANNAINVSAAVNAGVIDIAAGAGTNQITTSTGVDTIHVGQQYLDSTTLSAANGAATDVIWGWDDRTTSRDNLNVAAGHTAVVGALMGQTNWSNRGSWLAATGWGGNDTVDMRQQVSNHGLIQMAAGAGANTLYGSSGSDSFFVGYTHTSSGGTEASAAAIDMIYGWDAQAWSDLPLAGSWNSATNWNGAAVVDTTYDRLTVAAGSTARIGSLQGDSATDAQRWDGVEIVDLRSNVTNLNMVAADGGAIEIWTGSGNDYILGSSGRDLIYGGPGLDNLWGGAGDDVFYAGYSPSWAPFGADAAEPRIWDWQNGSSAATPGDGLRISSNSFVIIQGLWGMDSTNADRWAGNDTVDLRWDVNNEGKIIVETSTGNDWVYGSSGVDYINPGAGFNNLELGNGGADRVYLDSYKTRTQINGFSADDKIYLDTRLLEAFKLAKGIQTPSTYDITASATDTATGISSGQTIHYGNFITSQLTYKATFNATLRGYNEQPQDPDFNPYGGVGNGPIFDFGWTSNGAWNNAAYQSAHNPSAKGAVIGAGAASIAIGSGLAGIPFVGPILAIPFWVNGGLMLNDGINNVRPYLNPVYSGAVLDTGISVLSSALNPVSTSAWNDVSFLSFYNVANSGGFTPSLEIGSQQPGYTPISANVPIPNAGTFPYTFYQAPALTGVASYLAVYNGIETFIYLVASRDGLIQDNETILIAQVNGQVTHDQLVMYDGGTDAEYLRYFNNAVTAPVFPPNPTVDMGAISAANVMFKVSYKPVGFTKTEGGATTVESNVVTFAALGKGEQISLGGLTFTADRNLTAAETAQAFAGLGASATTGPGSAYGSYSGALSDWTSESAVSETVVFSSTTTTGGNLNVADLSLTANTVVTYLSKTDYDDLVASPAASDVSLNGVHTNSANINLNIGFDKPLTSADTVKVLVDGVLNGTYTQGSPFAEGATSLSVVVSGLTGDGEKAISVVVSNAEFEAQWLGTVVLDTTAPVAADVVITDAAGSLFVTSPEAGTAYLVPTSGTTLSAALSAALTEANNKQAQFTLEAQSSVTNYTVRVTDVLGHATDLSKRVVLGTNNNDTFTAAEAGAVYGFNGDDTLTASVHGNALYGGDGNDTLISGAGNDKITGGAGADVIDLRSGGADTLIYAADVAANTSDSNSTARDRVQGFDPADDVISVVATGVINFDPAANVQVATEVVGSATHYIGQLSFNDADYTDGGDLQIDFGSVALTLSALQSALQYNLTGTSAANNLRGGSLADLINGGGGDDTIAGGGGADILTGGAGNDTFVVGLSDSKPVITTVSGAATSIVSGFDSITDFELMDGSTSNFDRLDLHGTPTIAANTSGQNGADHGSIKSHAIVNGLVTFDDEDIFAQALNGSAFSLADAVGYLQANIGSGQAVVFNQGLHSYVFQENGDNDVLVEFSNITAAGLTDQTTSIANYLFIA
jgi:Ca2+-binding RTX toxin-like protein